MRKNFKVAVILAGCGARDGSEIQESTLALYALSKEGFETECFAPDIEVREVINHIDGTPMNQKRDVLIEAARIVRGKIAPLDTLDVDKFDALLFPGGSGSAKNIFTMMIDGLDFEVLPEVSRVIRAFNAASKPICGMCIAPVMLAKVLSDKKITITLGPQSDLCGQISERFGVTVEVCPRDKATVDCVNKVVTTPCYMYPDSTIAQIGDGAIEMVRRLKTMLTE